MKTFRIDCTLTYQLAQPTDFLFHIKVAHSAAQTVTTEILRVKPTLELDDFGDKQSQNRFTRLRAPAGPLSLRYRAEVMVASQKRNPEAGEVPIAKIPPEVLHYLMPTRYCESDVLERFARREFGALPSGYARVAGIVDWIRKNIEYRVGSSNSTTTAAAVMLTRAGVCRDFAHLGITFCRALDIPARIISAYAIFRDPNEEPDFHALFEAYLEGGWVMFDPTDWSDLDDVVRIGTGRDAKDVAFSTIFGEVQMLSMFPKIRELKKKKKSH
jgi:transglutaminase-like putative cysteine protease